MLISIIIRTLNEEKYLNELLISILNQNVKDKEIEIIIVDSGSTDETIKILSNYKCKIETIKKEDFTFGKSLNIGCNSAKGEILVFISGHCVPTSVFWLENLIAPLSVPNIAYTYGKQIGGPCSFYSECRIFEKYYSSESKIPQNNFFCNNANAALKRNIWQSFKFNEDLTGLEDMDLGKKIVSKGMKIAYVSDAVVFHHHQESWAQVRRRFQRESIALREILPHININYFDLIRYILISIIFDLRSAYKENKFLINIKQIILYRFNQYYGSYIGNKSNIIISKKEKEKFFFPINEND